MIALLKILPEKWEQAKGYLRLDLEAIEAALNTRWSIVFGSGNFLQPGTIEGDYTIDSRYVSNQGDDHMPLWDQVDLSNGVKNRLPFSNLVASTVPSVLVGRRSGSAGDFEEITLDTHLVMSSTTITIGNFTPGAIPFADASGFLTEDFPNLWFEEVSNSLIVANNTVLNDRELSFVFDGPVKFENNSTNGAAGMVYQGAASTTGFITFLTTSGAGTTDFINFRTGNNGAVEAMHINSPGNIGIGISAAEFPATGSKSLLFGDGTAPASLASNTAGLYGNDVSGTVKMFAIDEDGVTGQIAKLSGNLTAGSIVFKGSAGLLTEDNANFFWDDTNNRLGLRMTTPEAVLHVVDESGSGLPGYFDVYADSTTGGTLRLRKARGTVAAPRRAKTNDTLAGYNAFGASAADDSTNATFPINAAGQFRFFAAEDFTSSARGSYFRITTTLIGASASTDRLEITHNGNILIGTATNAGAGTLGLIFGDGTALSSMGSNTAGEFADDVGGTVEMFAINEANNVSQLTGLNIRKTADESVTNSTTPQADDHLTVNLAASSSYQFEIWGFWTTAGATAGITVQLDGTVGVSSIKADIAIIDYTTNVFAAFGRVTAFNSAVGAGLTGDNSFYIKGCIETTTAGTLFLEWAQNTADAVNATTLQENSYFVLRKLNA